MAKKTKEQISEIKEEIDAKLQESQSEKDSPKLDKKVREEYMTIYQKLKRFELLNKKKAKEKYTFKGLKEKEFRNLNGKTIVSDALSEESKVDKNSISLEMLNAQIDGYHKKVFLQEVEGLVNPAMKDRLLQMCTYNRGLSRDLPGMALFYKSMNGEKNRVKAAMLMVSYGLDDRESIALMETYFGPIDSKVIEFVEAFKKQTEGLSLNEIVSYAKHNTRDSVINQLKTEAAIESVRTGKDVNAMDVAAATYTNASIEEVVRIKEDISLFNMVVGGFIPKREMNSISKYKEVSAHYGKISKEIFEEAHTGVFESVTNEMKTRLAGKTGSEKREILVEFRNQFADSFDMTIESIEAELKILKPFDPGILTDPVQIERVKKTYNVEIREEAEKIFNIKCAKLQEDYDRIKVLYRNETDPEKKKQYEQQMFLIEKQKMKFTRAMSSKNSRETQENRQEKIFNLIEQKRRIESEREGLIKKLEELKQSNADQAEIEAIESEIKVRDAILMDIGIIKAEDEMAYDARQQEIAESGKIEFSSIKSMDDLHLLDQIDIDAYSQEQHASIMQELMARKRKYTKNLKELNKELKGLENQQNADPQKIEELKQKIEKHENAIAIIDKYIGGYSEFRRDLARKHNDLPKEVQVEDSRKEIERIFKGLEVEKTIVGSEKEVALISDKIMFILRQADNPEKIKILDEYLSKIENFGEKLAERHSAVKVEDYETSLGKDELRVIKVIQTKIGELKQKLLDEKYKVNIKIKRENASSPERQEIRTKTSEEIIQEKEEKKKEIFAVMQEETNKIQKMEIRSDGVEIYATSAEQAAGMINRICSGIEQLISKNSRYRLNEQEVIWCEDSIKTCELYLNSKDPIFLKVESAQKAIKKFNEIKLKFEQYKQNPHANAEKRAEKRQLKQGSKPVVEQGSEPVEQEQVETAVEQGSEPVATESQEKQAFSIAGEVDPVKAGEEIEKSPLPEPEGKTTEKQLQEEREKIEAEAMEQLNKKDP